MHLFSFGKLFCELFLLLFFFHCFLEIVREKRGRQGEDAWSAKYESVELCCSDKEQIIIINSNASK